MTERTGGSDVGRSSNYSNFLGRSETLAILNESDGSYALHGYKWFTSATTSEAALALAKVAPSVNSDVPKVSNESGLLKTQGSRNLSLFFVPMRKKNGELNNMVIHRLKDKVWI